MFIQQYVTIKDGNILKKSISVKEEDLERVFRVRGKLLDKNMKWPNNDYLYEVVQDELNFSFSIQPAFMDIRIKMEYKKNTICDLNYGNIEDIAVLQDGLGLYLFVKLPNDVRIKIRRTPSIYIEYGYSSEDLYFS